MPVYHFHLSGRGSYHRDDEGVVFGSLDQAYLEAYDAALDISFEMLRNRIDPNGHAFEIMDEDGTLLIDVPFAEVLHPRPSGRPSLPPGFRDTFRSHLERNRVLRTDLSKQISAARDTVASTAILLQRSRMATN